MGRGVHLWSIGFLFCLPPVVLLAFINTLNNSVNYGEESGEMSQERAHKHAPVTTPAAFWSQAVAKASTADILQISPSSLWSQRGSIGCWGWIIQIYVASLQKGAALENFKATTEGIMINLPPNLVATAPTRKLLMKWHLNHFSQVHKCSSC